MRVPANRWEAAAIATGEESAAASQVEAAVAVAAVAMTVAAAVVIVVMIVAEVAAIVVVRASKYISMVRLPLCPSPLIVGCLARTCLRPWTP